MAVTLLTLNIEGSRHLERVLPFLRGRADVVCLQEVFENDMPQLEAAVGCPGHFAPMTRKEQGVMGLALFTKLHHSPPKQERYVGDGSVPVHDAPDTADRLLFSTTIKHDGHEYTVGTTHFTWTPDGEPNERQWAAFQRLMEIVERHGELVLCGDFNAPRGKAVFSAFCGHFTDNLPRAVTTTLDSSLHRKPELHFAVDTIFSTPPYRVRDVRLFDKLSDHMALRGVIEK